MNLPPETGSGCERCAQTAKQAAPEKQGAAKKRPRAGRGSQLSAELVAHHAEQLEQTLRDARAQVRARHWELGTESAM